MTQSRFRLGCQMVASTRRTCCDREIWTTRSSKSRPTLGGQCSRSSMLRRQPSMIRFSYYSTGLAAFRLVLAKRDVQTVNA